MVLQPGQQLDEPVGEAGQGVGGVALEHAEVDDEVDRRVVRPDVAAPVDAGLDDAQVGGGGAGRGGTVHRRFSSGGGGRVGGVERGERSGLGGGDRDEQVGVLLDEGGEPPLGEVEGGARGQGVHGGAGHEHRGAGAGVRRRR